MASQQDIDTTVVRQSSIGQDIERHYINFNKDPKDRKQKGEYFQARLNILEKLYVEFCANHEVLVPVLDFDHAYWRQGYKEKIDQIYTRYKEAMEQQQRALLEGSLIKPSAPLTPSTTPTPTTPAIIVTNNNENTLDSNPAPNEEEVRQVKLQKVNMTSLERILQSLQQDIEQGSSTVHLQPKYEACSKYYSDVSARHQIVMCQKHMGDYKKDLFEYLEDQYFEISAKIRSSVGRSPASTNPNNSSSPHLKLPKIVIPVFDGNCRKWKQFQDIYEQMIHNQPNISNIEKFYYLKSNLTGEASRLVCHLLVTDENYLTAWDTLINRYDNPRVLVSACLADFLATPALTSETHYGLKRFHDHTKECLLAVRNLGVDIRSWDAIILQILLPKLDTETRRLYELSLKQPRELQVLGDFYTFIELRFQSLEAAGNKTHQSINPRSSNKPTYRPSTLMFREAQPSACSKCKGAHKLYKCDTFNRSSSSERLNHVKRFKLCVNCLNTGHVAAACASRNCMKCPNKHHTSLHESFQQIQQQATRAQPTNNQTNATSLAAQTNQSSQYVFLATAIVTIMDKTNKAIKCRALLDSGSQLNFVTERFAKKLNLKSTAHNLDITGIGSQTTKSQRRLNVELRSSLTGYSTRLEVFILPKITSEQPHRHIDTRTWDVPHNIQLADPAFNRPQPVDLLIGADIYCQLMSIGQFRPKEDAPMFQNTLLGWVVLGRANNTNTVADAMFCGISACEEVSLNEQLAKFWDIEEVDNGIKAMTTMELTCEALFKETVSRNEAGRFSVRLPFKPQEELGESKPVALQRFFSLEKRLLRHTSLRVEYTKFMREYEALHHMEEIQEADIPSGHYFLPHHCVLKPESSSTKLRVVYDASAKTTNNKSLNDILLTGPTIQDELFSILIRFRLHTYVFTADISKMYRQILVEDNDTWYQLIIWREGPTEPLKYYRLRTVTYGTSSASYLAIRCLHQLAQDGAKAFPLGSQITKRDFYVDDVMTGSDDLSRAIEIQTELKALLQSGGFPLRKWCANHSKLLQNVDSQDREELVMIHGSTEGSTKTLGLTWLPQTDCFKFQTSWPERKQITKRTVTSDTAHLFDPLGLVNPVVTLAKMFIQELWKLKLDWDAALPLELHHKWTRFRNELPKIQNIAIERHVLNVGKHRHIQVHIFSDASEKAYGTAVYLRSINEQGKIKVSLLCAKSKVAPSKITTIPRLELCAAKLATQLANRLKDTICINVQEWRFWTDSTIVLSWIAAPSSSLHTFVANRVAYIQRSTNIKQWRHIGSKANPADLTSRGMYPDQLIQSNLWFQGPEFLSSSEDKWPASTGAITGELLEAKGAKTALLTTKIGDCNSPPQSIIESIHHHNSFQRLQETLAFITRFWANASKPANARILSIKPEPKEMERALELIVKHIQKQNFNKELKELANSKCISKDSKLASLTPFLDDHGIIRVGGRLERSSLPFNAKHPILLAGSDPLTRIMFHHLHTKHLHAGSQALLAIVRQRFWPTRGKCVARIVVKQCMKCARAKPMNIHQLMGNLPAERIEAARPFMNVGIDFCGPITIHYKIRGKRPTKTYIAVFVCFAVKAVHLELVSDLTTASFIGALKRFIARRGCPTKIFCDNATNFVGARSALQQLYELFQDKHHNAEIISECSRHGIQWQHIPPRSPHFGGLWEAAVKSAKYHLKRITSAATLTYEELATVITEIEATLNSRPITPLSEDPNDLQALTPGHFLIGEPLRSIADGYMKDRNINSLSRWELVTRLRHEFWNRWSKEYLQELQLRTKWKNGTSSVKVGSLVLLKDPNLPPLQWIMARIIKMIPGDDGRIRVVEVKTATGNLTRAVHNICPLPDTEQVETEEATKRATEPLKQIPAKRTDTTTSAEKPESKAPPRYKIPKLSTTATTLLLLTTLIMPVFTMNPIEVTPFNSTPGLYFENLGKVSLVSDEWKIIVYYDMKTYWNEINGLRECIWVLTNLCEKMKGHRTHCEAVATHLSHQFQVISHIDDVILTGHAVKVNRAKRSPFDFIGSAANALFGILDQGYAAQIEKEIMKGQVNQEHLLDLIKNQTSLIDATTNILQKVEDNINKQFSQIYDTINNITNQLNEQEDVAQAFSALATQTVAVAADCRNMQNAIIDLLTDTHHGRINPLLLTPEQLKSELSMIRENLPPNTMIPGSNTGTELLTSYTLIKARGRLTLQYLIVTIDLPLVNIERYDILAITAFPMRYKDTLIFIKPSTEYLVVNIHQDSYFALSEQKFRECISLTDEGYICNQQYPVFKSGSQAYKCETTLLSRGNDISQCKFDKTEAINWWTALHSKNEWLFSLAQELSFTAVCEGIATQKSIKDNGRLKLNSACIIRHPLVTIASPGNKKSALKTPVITLNISEGFTINKTQQVNLHPLTINNSADISTLKKAIQGLQEMEQSSTGLSFHDLHQYAVSYSSIAMLGICLTIFMTWKYRNRKRAPTPAPRNSQHPPSSNQSRDELFELQEIV